MTSRPTAGPGPRLAGHLAVGQGHRLGVIKTGKEADVSLLDRSLPGGPGCLLAVKTFRNADHRMFHRDAGYLEGRRMRRSRETRAMATRTGVRPGIAGRPMGNSGIRRAVGMWKAGARVPYPVQLIGSELMMEFIGDPDGTAAPRLAAVDATTVGVHRTVARPGRPPWRCWPSPG